MSLSRKDIRTFIEDESLSTEEKVAKIIAGHIETVDGLNDKITSLERDSERLESVQKELDGLKSANTEEESWKEKYEAEHSAFENYKTQQVEAELRTSKERLVSDYYKGKGITTENGIKLAMGYSKGIIDSLELDDNGKIKDSSGLEKLIKNELAGLIVKEETSGAKTVTPPKNEGGATMTIAEIANIKDADAQLKAIKQNASLFIKK